MDSIRVSEAPDTGSIPVEATKTARFRIFKEIRLLEESESRFISAIYLLGKPAHLSPLFFKRT